MAQAYPHLHVVILCEDYGSKLWPIAREQAPACLAPASPGSDASLLAATVERLRPYTDEAFHVVTTEQLAPIIYAELLGGAGLSADEVDLLVEPVERGSAFSIALAVSKIRNDDPGAIVAVFPSNQSVDFDDRWGRLMGHAYRAALADRVVLLGGEQEDKCADSSYIRKGRPLEGSQGTYEVRLFVADAEPAGARRAHGEGALWYTGVFFARAACVVGDFLHADEVAEAGGPHCAARIIDTAGFLAALDSDVWLKDDAKRLISALPRVSYEQVAVQPSQRLAVIPTSVVFSTVNTLEDLEATSEPDPARNRMLGSGYTVLSRNTTVYAQGDGRRIITLGLQDAMVIDTPGTLLVAQKDRLGNMDDVFAVLHEDGMSEKDVASMPDGPAEDDGPADGPQGPDGERPAAVRSFPWGTAESIAAEGGYAIWRLALQAAARLEGLSVPSAYGQFGASPYREQYVVTSGEVEIRGAGDAQPIAMGAGDAFEVDASDPLVITAARPATLVLTAVS